MTIRLGGRRGRLGRRVPANRPLSERAGVREEQVNSDRLPARRGENLAIAPRVAVASLDRNPVKTAAAASRPWQAIDQALRATDLLLQGGGFSLIVLDMGGTPAEIAWRIPLATWFRYRAACERTRVSLLLLTQHPCARSSAELVVRLETGTMEAESKVMTGIGYRAGVERNRSAEERTRVVSIRKPPQPERAGVWRSEAAWAQAR